MSKYNVERVAKKVAPGLNNPEGAAGVAQTQTPPNLDDYIFNGAKSVWDKLTTTPPPEQVEQNRIARQQKIDAARAERERIGNKVKSFLHLQSSEGQPPEATMIGTNNNAAPRQATVGAAQPVNENARRMEEEAMNILEGAKVAEEAPLSQEESDKLKKDYEDYYKPGGTLDQENIIAQKKKELLEETKAKYAQSVTTPGSGAVQANDIKPTPQELSDALANEVAARQAATATQTTPENTGKFAVPTAEERQAWGNKTYSNNTVMSQALDNLAAQTADPKEKALYSMMADRARQYEGWQEEENAYRRGQAAAAREMRDRTTAAAQRRDKREYEDQDPSWVDTLRKVPIIQNLIGVRRLNPETMEMEWHYPRNAAEGVGALLTSLPMIAHAAVTGDNRMQKEYRGMEQNQMFYPYRMDYADMEDYRRGAMVQPTPTWSDKMAAGMSEASFAGMKEKQRLMGIETTAEYIRNKYGNEMADSYIKSALGVPQETGAISGQQLERLLTGAEYLANDPYVSAEAVAGVEMKLVDAISQFPDPNDPTRIRIENALNAIRNRGKIQTTLSGKDEGAESFTDSVANRVESMIESAYNNSLPIDANTISQFPREAQEEIMDIARGYQQTLKSYPNDPSIAQRYLKERLANSAVIQSIGFNWEDTSFRSPVELLYQGWLNMVGKGDEARRRYKQGDDVLWNSMGKTYDTRGARRARAEDELYNVITRMPEAPPAARISSNWARAQAAKNAAVAQSIQNELKNPMSNVNTTVY